VQSIFEPIIVTDGKGHVLKVNQASAELMGEPPPTLALAINPWRWRILRPATNPERHTLSRLHAEAGGPQKDEARAVPMRTANRSAAIACAPPPCATPTDTACLAP